MRRLRELLERIPPVVLAILGIIPGILAWALPLPPEGKTTVRIILIALAVVLLVVGVLPYLHPTTVKPFSWLFNQFRRRRSDLWLFGGPVGAGVLLGGMEWLISRDLLNSLGISLATYVLVQLSFVWWSRRVRQLEEDKVLLGDKIQDLHNTIGKLLFEKQYTQGDEDTDITLRCMELAQNLYGLLKQSHWEDPEEILRRYEEQFKNRLELLRYELMELPWWDSAKDIAEKLHHPKTLSELSDVADTLQNVHEQFWRT